MPLWLREKLFQKKMLFNELKKHDKNFNNINKIYFSEHHFSHAASAFYPSHVILGDEILHIAVPVVVGQRHRHVAFALCMRELDST